MAEMKYDLMLVPTKTDGKIYNQPWYKERLKTKYIKSLGPRDTSKFLNGHNWTFVKDGLDDFRDGLPPPVEGGEVLKGSKGLAPNVVGSSDNVSSVKQPAVRGRFTKDQICFSRVTPLQQQRRSHIEEIEYGLTQHPLALYPHLEECMPPDVFEDVVDILDPEMNLASDEEESLEEEVEVEGIAVSPQAGQGRPGDGDSAGDEKGSAGSRRSHLREYPTGNASAGPSMTPTGFMRTAVQLKKKIRETREIVEQRVKNPYRWLPRKEETDKKDRKKAAERRSSSPSQDEHIKHVTQEFCDWVSSLGGESNNIEESTIMSLFASGYETKPALSVPIHVVELTNVPPELRMSANVPATSNQNASNIPVHTNNKNDWTYSGNYEPSWIKFKYGAWYLPSKTWKKRPAEEPLRDPQEIKDQEMSEAKKKGQNLDSELAPMHGAKAFMEFIDNKSVRRPEFLNRVREIQEQTAREELARQEAEIAAKKKAEAKKAARNAAGATTK